MVSTGAIRDVIAAGGPDIVYQPIVRLIRPHHPDGYEALSRFPDGESPLEWFRRAWEAGLGMELEKLAVRNAVERFMPLHERSPAVYLAVNVSPHSLIDGQFRRYLRSAARQLPLRIVIELSEGQVISDYAEANVALDELRDVGIALAIDDLGAGFASLLHVLRLLPEHVKIDRELIKHVPDDHLENAVVAAIVAMARAMGASVVGEGVETKRQADALTILGVTAAQGWHFGRPAPLRDWLEDEEDR